MPLDRNKSSKPPVTLSEQERTLVTLREELYAGSWVRMKEDLTSRLNGKPYIFKLATRIEEDLKTIDTLQRKERRAGINLAELIEYDEW